MIKNKDVEIFEYYGNRASVTMDLKDNKLKTYIHDYSGWIFNTKNVVVALYVLKDKTIKDLISNSLDDTKIISILDSKLEYDKELIINSLEEDGDLQWISWLTKNYFNYGNDKEYIYSIVTEDFEEQGYDYENEEDYKAIDEAYWNLIDKYDSDNLLEEMRDNYKDDIIYIIEKSSSYSELTEEIEELSNEIYLNANDYRLDFIAENQTYSF